MPRGGRAPEDDEPERLAEAAARLGLKHVVITSVTRDDLPDGGADHFYQCVMAVRAAGATIEVLTPDFSMTPGLDASSSRPGSVQPQHGNGAAAYRRSRGPSRNIAGRWICCGE